MSQEEMSQAANSNPKGDIGSIPLVIPEGIRYNCQACGRCCSGWAVGLTESDWQKVKDVDWSSLHPELKDKELFVHREEEFEKGLSLYPHFTKARPDGRCSFLVDGLCFMHSHLGEDSKPGVCKLLPYTYVPTPSGIFVGVTYNSMASVRNIGELLSNQVPMLEQTWRRVVDQQMNMGKASELEAQQATSVTVENMSAIRFQVNLMAGIPLTWDEYLTIENNLCHFTVNVRCTGGVRKNCQ
jgi:Fe-S-cluster containining protein